MDEAKQPEWKSTFRVGNYTCEMTYNEGGTLKAKWTWSAQASMTGLRRSNIALR
jgi:hypothetical protein